LRSIPFLLIPVLLLVWVGWQDSAPGRFFLEDPAALVKLPVGTGMIAVLGVSIWVSCGFLGMFASSLTLGRVRVSLLTLSLFCLWLGIDDLLLLHEDVVPRLFFEEERWRFWVEVTMFGSYGLALGAWILVFRKNFSPLHWSFLLASLLLFASSIGLDMARGLHVFDPWSRMVKDEDYAILVEDSPKFLGLFCWALFFWHYCKSSVQARISVAQAD